MLSKQWQANKVCTAIYATVFQKRVILNEKKIKQKTEPNIIKFSVSKFFSLHSMLMVHRPKKYKRERKLH